METEPLDAEKSAVDVDCEYPPALKLMVSVIAVAFAGPVLKASMQAAENQPLLLGSLVTEFVRNFGGEDATPI
jgi:hypothetical protein